MREVGATKTFINPGRGATEIDAEILVRRECPEACFDAALEVVGASLVMEWEAVGWVCTKTCQ